MSQEGSDLDLYNPSPSSDHIDLTETSEDDAGPSEYKDFPESTGCDVRPSESCTNVRAGHTGSSVKRKLSSFAEPEILEDYDDIKEEFESPILPRKKIKSMEIQSRSESESETLLQPGKSFLVKDFTSGPTSTDTGLSENLDKDYDLSKIFKLSPKESKPVEKGKGEAFHDEGESSTKVKQGVETFIQKSISEEDVELVKEMFPHLEEKMIFRILKKLQKTDEDTDTCILERVIDYFLKTELPSPEKNTASQDVQAALGNTRPAFLIQATSSSSTPTQSDELPKLQCRNRTNRGQKGASNKGNKGKAPAKKIRTEVSYCESEDNVMELDGYGSESSASSSLGEVAVSVPPADRYPVSYAEVSSSLLKCDACGSQQETTAISQCCNDHLVCKTCVEKQVKSVISLDSQDTQISCPMFGCNTYIPMSQASKVLPSLVMELLEEKVNKKAMESITQMEDLHSCPFCNYPVAVDHDLKKFSCPNPDCEKLSCRFCKKMWNEGCHNSCNAFTTFLDESNNHLELPKYWDKMPTEQTDFILVELDRSGMEFKMIKDLFCSSLKNINPISIRRVQNPRLWEKFSLTRKHMAEEKENLNEKQLFHGTKSEAIETICRDGLDWRMCGENGVAFGQGTYFAKHAKYSDTYCVPYSGNRGSSAVQQPRVPVVKIRSVSKNPNLHYTVSVSNPMFGPTVTLQGTGGQASTSNIGPSSVGLLNSNVIITPVAQPTSVPFQQISALHGIGTQMGFGAVTMGTPFGSPQTAQTTGNNHSNPSQSSVADAPKVTADVGQILRVQHKYMFVARVLVGCPGQGRPGLRKPPEDPIDPRGRTFHSCVNSLQKPSIFVIFDSTQCYPEYLIEYVNLNSNR